MLALFLTLLIPLFGAGLMALLGSRRFAGAINTLLMAASFIAALFLAAHFVRYGTVLALKKQFYVDAFNLLSIVLTTFVAATTAWFSQKYMWHNVESGRISPGYLRLYHMLYQIFIFTMLLALTTNNIGILWVAMEGATLATVMLVSLYRTPEAIEAAWKYFILCIVGIALALLGTILVYSSSVKLLTNGDPAILWSILASHASFLNPQTLKLAFIFLLVGYGTKIGLIPMHNWLPDAHSESPAPMSTLLSGLLLNVALYALVRFKILTDAALGTHFAGNLMMTFGLLSFVIAAVLLHHQRNIKRLFSYSSIEHMGLMTFAFGLGGPIATFGAVFYMLMHSLTKAAIFTTVGNVIQLAGTQSLDKIRGLLKRQPVIGWGMLIAAVAISGFPPFGIFTSELMILIAAMKTSILLTIIIGIGFIIALAGILRAVQPMAYGDPDAISRIPSNMSAPILHLGLVLILGVYMPPFLGQILQQATNVVMGIV